MGFVLPTLFALFVSGSPPASPEGLNSVEAGFLGAAVGGLAGGVLLGVGTLATGIAISEKQCRAGCDDSDGTAFIIGSPYAAGFGLVAGAVIGVLVGVALTDEAAAPVCAQCSSTVVGVCPSSQFCL